MKNKDELLKAIERLKERNQFAVNTYGNSKGVREMDEIINTIIEHYNDFILLSQYLETCQEQLKRVLLILKLLNIDIVDFNFDPELIQNQLRDNVFTPSQISAIAIVDTRLSLINKKLILTHYLDAIQAYHEITIPAFRELQKLYYPELYTYFISEDKLTNILERFKLNYYAGNITTSYHETEQQATEIRRKATETVTQLLQSKS